MWCLIFISTIVELKQVLLSTFLFLRIEDRPFHNGEFFTDFYASEKTTDDVKKAARNSVHSKITKYFRSLYFLLISIANSLFSDGLSATFEVIISFIFNDSIAFTSAGNCIAICRFCISPKWKATESLIFWSLKWPLLIYLLQYL